MSKEELIEKADEIISNLVINKVELQKAYNYYNGIRDAEQFKYLKDNFGIGNPTSVEFTPLIKKHIDALIGEFLGVPILPKVSCKDSETISNINRDKQLYIASELAKFLQNKLKNSLLQFLGQKQITDANIQEQLEKLKMDLDTNFISEYEVAAQNVIEYIMQSRKTDMTTTLRHLFLDLLIAGYCIYRCKPSVGNNNVAIEVLNPKDTFIDRNPDSVYIKDAYRCVIRKRMSKEQILNKYGRDLSQTDIQDIKDNWEDKVKEEGKYYISGRPGDRISSSVEGLDYGVEAQTGYPYDEQCQDYYNNELIPVYEVEWIETDKDFVMQRYNMIRISENIYIVKGKCENVVRTKDNPSYCGLSINGVYFTNRSSKPYSLMQACFGLQDRYDLLNFLRDSILQNSGTIGDYVDMSMLPEWLGDGPAERLQAYISYKKIGIAPIDSMVEQRAMAGIGQSNTWMSGFDDTVKAPAIQAIQYAIDSLEQTVCSITGVFRERLNGIEQRDAVTNIKQGAQNSFIVTKQYYQQMNLITAEMLSDALDVAKEVYKNGLTGTLILGDKYQKFFTALPQYFTLSDFDIHVVTSTEVIRDLETVKQLIPEFIRSQTLAPEIIFEALTSKSLPELKHKALVAMRKQKEENNQLQQLQQQGQQLAQQLQQAQQQLQQASQKIEALNEQKMQLESQKMQSDFKVAWFSAQTDRTYKTKQNEINQKKIDIQLSQLTDGNPYNDKFQ